ncbi:hypothetical protein LJC42_04575 [Eubacteriales bacterium OttesenSCG-928-K08]|nr:hypothetical protein [Eubacteriales bacterium OttesenSCG-928-K08]
MGTDGFLLSIKTKEGHPIAVGGLCEQGYEAACLNDFLALKKLLFPAGKNIITVDEILAQALSTLSKQYVWAVGAAVSIPGYNLATGGVIGSPHENSSSAAGNIEDIGHGLFLFSNPGGPGFVVEAKKEQAERLFSEGSKLCCYGKDIKSAAEFLHREGFCFLAVADGTGTQNGGVAVGTKNELLLNMLDQT